MARRRHLLTESDVIDAVCRFLEARGYRVTQKLNENQRGDDIIALDPRGESDVRIEAKGETSSKPRTSRFGKPFSASQVLDHVAKAFFRTATYASCERRAGIALPGNPHHIARIREIEPVLRRLHIEVFWVRPNGKVDVVGNWNSGSQ